MCDDDDLIGALYATLTRDDALAVVLDMLARRFRCPSAVLVYVDPLRPEADIALAHGLSADAAAQQRYREEYAKDDPAPAAMARLSVGQAAATGRLFTADSMAASRFINEFYYPLGLREALGGPFVKQAGRFGLIAVHRGVDRLPFSDQDIACFERLLSHVMQVAELRNKFFQIKNEASSLADAIDPAATGIMIFDRQGGLSHANRAARTILARRDGLELLYSGRLKASDKITDGELQKLFERPEYMSAGKVLRFPRSGGQSHYVARVWRERLASREPWIDAGLSIYVSDPDREVGDISAALAEALDLSKPGAQLTAALLSGDDLASYARRHKMSQNTVKFHLKAAFAITGCRRQADLVRIAGTIVRDLALKQS